MRYAVIEYEGKPEDCEGWVTTLAKYCDKETAEWYLKICPDKYTREIITMDEYEEMEVRDERTRQDSSEDCEHF